MPFLSNMAATLTYDQNPWGPAGLMRAGLRLLGNVHVQETDKTDEAAELLHASQGNVEVNNVETFIQQQRIFFKQHC